jgi:hypothetical protein
MTAQPLAEQVLSCTEHDAAPPLARAGPPPARRPADGGRTRYIVEFDGLAVRPGIDGGVTPLRASARH